MLSNSITITIDCDLIITIAIVMIVMNISEVDIRLLVCNNKKSKNNRKRYN